MLARVVFKNTVLFPRYHSAVQYGPYTLRRIQPNITFWHTSPDGSWEFRINAQGFRDDQDYEYVKPPGALRVLVLGDSHTAGFEVEQEATFPEVIERYLRLRGKPAEVLNTGISGFGTAEQLAFLEAEGVRYEPDVIILGFFANDYENAVRSKLFAVEDGRLVSQSRSYAPATSVLQVLNAVPPLRWLSENSHLYSVAMNAAWMMAKTAVAAAAEEDLEVEYAVPSEGLTDYNREFAVRLLERMHAVARKARARFIVAIFRCAADGPVMIRKTATAKRNSSAPCLRRCSRRFGPTVISSSQARRCLRRSGISSRCTDRTAMRTSPSSLMRCWVLRSRGRSCAGSIRSIGQRAARQTSIRRHSQVNAGSTPGRRREGRATAGAQLPDPKTGPTLCLKGISSGGYGSAGSHDLSGRRAARLLRVSKAAIWRLGDDACRFRAIYPKGSTTLPFRVISEPFSQSTPVDCRERRTRRVNARHRLDRSGSCRTDGDAAAFRHSDRPPIRGLVCKLNRRGRNRVGLGSPAGGLQWRMVLSGPRPAFRPARRDDLRKVHAPT